MDLFEFRDGRAFPTIHALMIQPFKAMWQEDTSADHSEAILAFSFIELMCSPKKSNPFIGYEKDVRYIKLKEELFGDSAYELPYLVVDGIAKYEQLLENSSPSYPLLQSAFNAAGKLKTFFNSFNLNERTNSGASVYKPRDITSALKDVDTVIKSLESTRNKINEEMLSSDKTRNNREVGLYEE